LSIHNGNLLANPTTPLILYLPPTGVHLRHLHPPPRLHPLFDPDCNKTTQRQLPIARINYRWNIPLSSFSSPSGPRNSATHPFPTPLHDTLHAYTWLTTSFLPSFKSNDLGGPSTLRSPSPYASASSQAARCPSLRPLLVYGSFLGGTLACSLSLTETRVRPVGSSIHGVVIHNGVFDWTHVATSRAPSLLPTTAHHATADDSAFLLTGRDVWDLDTLHALKTRLFPSPASAFDPFASPLLFFRSAGLSVPSYFPGTSPSAFIMDDDMLLDGLSLSEEEITSFRERMSSSQSEESGDEEIVTSRRSTLQYPPKASGLRIPRSLFLTTSTLPETGKSCKRARTKVGQGGDEPHRQAEELARLMRRSVVMHEFKDRVLRDEDGDPHAASEERVQVHELRMDEGKHEQAKAVEEWLAELELE
jgi:hypothetical protein